METVDVNLSSGIPLMSALENEKLLKLMYFNNEQVPDLNGNHPPSNPSRTAHSTMVTNMPGNKA